MTRDLVIQPPLGGVNKSLAYQWQKPFTTPYALNVSPYDVLAQRQRLGSRMGLSKTLASRPVADVCRVMFTTTVSSTNTLLAVGGSNTSFLLRKYTGGAWSDIPMFSGTNIASLASSYRIQAISVGTAGQFWITSPGWTNKYYLYAPGTGNYLTETNISTSAYLAVGQYLGTTWRAETPRNWNDSDGNSGTLEIDGDYDQSAPITAFIPWRHNMAVFCTRNATQVLEGHPVTGGRFVTASTKYGCLDALSWCKGPNDALFVACNEGIVRWDSPYQDPDLTLFNNIPSALRGVDPTAYHISMVYDQRINALQVFVTKVSASAGVDHYTYDFTNQSWWVNQYQTDHEPFCVLPLFSAPSGVTLPTYSSFIMGCRDGYIRNFDASVATDDSSAVTSTLFIGPLLGDTMTTQGIVSEIWATLASGGGSVTWSIHCGDSAEEAYVANAFNGQTGTWTAGSSYTARPRARCHTWYLKLTATSAKWAIEKIIARCQAAGVHRR